MQIPNYGLMRLCLISCSFKLSHLIEEVQKLEESDDDDDMEGLRIAFNEVIGELCESWHAAQFTDKEYKTLTDDQQERLRLCVPKFHMDLKIESNYWQDPFEKS